MKFSEPSVFSNKIYLVFFSGRLHFNHHHIGDRFVSDLVVAKVNTDENSEWAMHFGVQGIPTMLFVAHGKIVHQQVGALPEPVLRQIVSKFLEIAQSAN